MRMPSMSAMPRSSVRNAPSQQLLGPDAVRAQVVDDRLEAIGREAPASGEVDSAG